MKNCNKVSKCGKKKTLILKDSRGFIPFEGIENIYTYYLSYSVFARGIRKVLWKLKPGFVPPFFYGKWKSQLKDADLVILFDCGVKDFDVVAKYIKSVNPSIRTVFWYWNPVESGCAIPKKDCIDEIWTYNRFDAKKYNLRYNPQFFHKNLIVKNNDSSMDMIFLGRDKGRDQILSEIKENAQKQDLKCNFILVKTKDDSMEYKDYIKNVACSKCVVDLVPNQFCGLTLRPLEALFFEKKLITNYKDIVNYDFYRKENVFIIGKDDMNKLAKFVNSPYKKVDKKIVDFYSYDSWLKRIEKGENIEP